MATFASLQNLLQPAAGGTYGNLKAWWGYYNMAAALSANDLINLAVIPRGGLILGGWMITDDIDTGTEALQIDVGWTANGGASTDNVTTNDGQNYTNAGYTGSATGLIASGVLNGDAVVDLSPAGSNYRYFNGLKSGPKYFSQETQMQAKITAAANAGGTGNLLLVAVGIIV